MRLVRYRPRHGPAATETRLGVLVGDVVHGHAAGLSTGRLIAEGRLASVGAQLLTAPDEVVRLADLSLAAPVQTPPSLRDFMAFERHVEGMGRLAGATPTVPDVWYRQPLYYFSNRAPLRDRREAGAVRR